MLLCWVLFLALPLLSQDDQIPVREGDTGDKTLVFNHKYEIGVGFGLDYGGVFGMQFGFAPIKHLVIFGAAGYHMVDFGWEAGVKGLLIRKTSEKVFRPFLKVMYGTNSVFTAEDTDRYDKVYRGFTAGIGAEFRFGQQKHHGFNVDLNIPIRTQEFWDDCDYLESIGYSLNYLPVAASVGYHYEF